jgi:hypothetical protein
MLLFRRNGFNFQGFCATERASQERPSQIAKFPASDRPEARHFASRPAPCLRNSTLLSPLVARLPHVPKFWSHVAPGWLPFLSPSCAARRPRKALPSKSRSIGCGCTPWESLGSFPLQSHRYAGAWKGRLGGSCSGRRHRPSGLAASNPVGRQRQNRTRGGPEASHPCMHHHACLREKMLGRSSQRLPARTILEPRCSMHLPNIHARPAKGASGIFLVG